MRKIIFDVDTGSDDACALMLALLNDKIDVLGITVVRGNNPVEKCVEHTLQIVELCKKNTPVYQGCSDAIVKRLDPYRLAACKGNVISYTNDKGELVSLHPEEFPLPKPKLKVQKQHACSYIVETLMNTKEKITLVAVGPATNLGMAFRMEPRIANNIEEVVFMGGSVEMGNVSATAEANFFNDPEAIKIILNSGVKIKMMTLNATESCSLSMDMSNQLASLNTPYGKFADYLIKTRADVSVHLGWHDGNYEPIHDPLAIAYLIDPSIITDIRQENVDIVTSGIAEGTLILDHRISSKNSNVYIAYKADRQKYFDLLKETFKNNEA